MADNAGDHGYAEYRARLESLKKRIEKKGDYDLKTLERAGVPRETMLSLLALAASHKTRREMISIMRKRGKELRSLAASMENLWPDLDKLLRDPMARTSFWTFFAGPATELGIKEPSAWTWRDSVAGAFMVPSGMRVLAQMFREEAKQFAWFSRTFCRPDSQVNVALVLMRVYLCRVTKESNEHKAGRVHVKLSPKHGPDHLDALARLFTDAFESAGVNKYGEPLSSQRDTPRRKRPDECFSPDGLRQVWKRTGIGMLSTYWQNLSRKATVTTQNVSRAATTAATESAILPVIPTVHTKPDTSDR